jgi:hypothetical protein
MDCVYDVYYTYEWVVIAPGYYQSYSYQIYNYDYLRGGYYTTITQTYYFPPIMGMIAVPHVYVAGNTLVPYSTVVGDFDYESIMLYSWDQLWLRAKVAKQGLKVGDKIPINTKISVGDIATVKRMY